MKNESVLKEDANLAKFQLGIMKNVGRYMDPEERAQKYNWSIVRDYLLGGTSTGGSGSAMKQCRFMGVDPDGFTFNESK